MTDNYNDITLAPEGSSPVEGWFINQRDWRGMSRTFAENQFGRIAARFVTLR
jgi:hypothetical protein